MKIIFTLLVSFLIGITFVQAQWISQTVPANSGGINDIEIIDANVVWALGSGTAPNYPGTVLRTTNGGATWNAIPINSPGINGQFMIYSLDALDANTAFAVGEDYTPATGGITRILKTTDAGQSWNIIPGIYTSPSSVATFIQFFDMNNGLVFGDNQEIYTTNNGGNTWTQVPASNLPPNAGHLDASLNLRAVVGNTIWVPVNGMRIYKSTDRGLTWTISTPNITTPVILESIAFQDANNGLANLGNNLIRTVDGGQTWTTVNYTGPFLFKGLTHISGLPDTYISYRWVTNHSGMSITKDNGLTWSQLDSNVHISAAFLNSQLGWSGGLNVIYKLNSKFLGAPKESSLATNFTISPNPGTGIFRVSGNQMQPFTLEVFNVIGLKVYQTQNASFTSAKIDLTNQPKGIYIVRIFSKGQTITKQIVLN